MAASKEDRRETLRWAVLATHLNGAVDSRKYDHIDTEAVLGHVRRGDLFDFLKGELGNDVAYALDKMKTTFSGTGCYNIAAGWPQPTRAPSSMCGGAASLCWLPIYCT